MSSSYVRSTILDFIDDNSNEDVIDLTSQYEEIKELISSNGVQPDAPWIGVQFIGYDEIPVGLAATNDQGLYRETGAIYIHVVDVARLGGGTALISRGEVLRDLFRGSRIESIVIEGVTPMNDEDGATLQFEGGYMSASFMVSYYRDFNL